MSRDASSASDWLDTVDRTLAQVEAAVVVGVLTTMVALAAVQLYLRSVHDFGFEWADILIRQLVLGIAFVGGALATYHGRHIAIDAATRLMPPGSAGAVRAGTSLIAVAISLVMLSAAWSLFVEEWTADTVLYGPLKQWWFTAAIPIAMATTAVHFAIGVRRDLMTAFRQHDAPAGASLAKVTLVAGAAAVAGVVAWMGGPWWPMTAVIALLAILGLPLFAVVAALTMLGYAATETDLSTLVIEMAGVASAPALVAIPLFTFAGYLMAESGTPNRLVAVARATVGWLPGGLAVVAVVACAFFTAFTGASGITIIALGGLLFPVLLKEGFPEKFSLGLLTSGGSLGLLFPPSLPVILYAIVAGVDVDRLFLAALIPGFLLVAVMAAYSAVVAVRTDRVQRVPFSWSALQAALWAARWEIPLPILILGGIYGGWLTVNEAAVVTVVTALIVQCGAYRDLHLTRDVPQIAVKSSVLVGAILLILGVALGFTNYLILEEVPDRLLALIQQNVSTQVGFLISLNLFLLLVGCVLDIFSAIIVVVPLILPLASAYGVDPLHLGVIFLTNLEIGYMTPPVGMNLFLSAFRFQRSLPSLYVASIPFIALLFAALLVITYVPSLSLGWAG